MIAAWIATYLLELRLGVRSRRFFAFAFFFMLPVLLAVLMRVLSTRLNFDMDEMRYYLFVELLYFMLVVPLASLLHGSGVVRNDLEQGTWTYHLMTPLRTWQTLVAKYCAAVTMVCLLALPSLALTHVAFFAASEEGVLGHVEISGNAAAAIVLSTTAYSAIFAAFGVAVRRPLIVGCIYGLITEYAVQVLPGQTLMLKGTVSYHLRSIYTTDTIREALILAPDPVRAMFSLEDPAQAAVGILLIAGCFLALASVILTRRELISAK